MPAPALGHATWTTPEGGAATPTFLRALQTDTVQWWAQNRRRDLPWRSNLEDFTHIRYDAYAVWVSEVMSQQTRMDTVIKYFPAWMREFPTVEAVAAASEDDVRRAWAGLGFYRRALYLHRGAQHIVAVHRERHSGGDGPAEVGKAHAVTMPDSFKKLCKVPGIGPYTAAAIASVCFGEAVAAVDGNLVRVLSRLRGERSVDPKSAAWLRAANAWGNELMLGGGEGGSVCRHPGAMNQGLMEIGSSICRPSGAPLCQQCPLRTHCTACSLLKRGEIPAIEGVIPLRGSKPKVRDDVVVCVVHELNLSPSGERRFLMVRRPVGGLLGGMLEFPGLTASTTGDADALETPARMRTTEECVSRLTLWTNERRGTPVAVGTVKHIFSHINMLVHVYYVPWGAHVSAEKSHRKTSSASAAFTNGAVSLAEDELCQRLASALEGDRDDATNDAPREHGNIRDPRRKNPADVVLASPRERISILTEASLRSAAPSRLCLKVLQLVLSQDDKPKPEPKSRRGSSAPRKKVRKH